MMIVYPDQFQNRSIRNKTMTICIVEKFRNISGVLTVITCIGEGKISTAAETILSRIINDKYSGIIFILSFLYFF